MARTYHDLRLDARRELEQAGIEAADFESWQILSTAAGKTREELLRDETLFTSDEVIKAVQSMVARRRREEPLAYVLGEWSFHHLDFYVDKTALIPRIDTEILAELAISELRKYSGNTRALDLCAGTGCLGITIASAVKTCRSVLVELDDGPLELCKRNIRRHKLTGRVVQLKGDVTLPPSPALGQFDVVVCNPPYIATGEIPYLDASVKEYEPHLALDGGPDGLKFYRAVAELWKPALKQGGTLFFEVGIDQAKQVATIMARAGYTRILITRDTNKIERVVSGRRPYEAVVIPFPDGQKQED